MARRQAVLAAISENEGKRLWRLGQEEREELERALIRPMQILHDAHRGSEGADQLPECPKDPVTLRSRVAYGRGFGRKDVRQLGQERPQCPNHGAQRSTGGS